MELIEPPTRVRAPAGWGSGCDCPVFALPKARRGARDLPPDTAAAGRERAVRDGIPTRRRQNFDFPSRTRYAFDNIEIFRDCRRTPIRSRMRFRGSGRRTGEPDAGWREAPRDSLKVSR